MNFEEFYRERDRRTRECKITEEVCRREIFVAVGKDAVETQRGQFLVLSLVNMLSRMHRCVRILSPDMPLCQCSMVNRLGLNGGRSFLEAVHAVARKADPFIEIREGVADSGTAAIGVGRPDVGRLPYYVGSIDDLVTLGEVPLPADPGGGFSLGAGLAACIGAAALLRQAAGMNVLPVGASAWSLTEAKTAAGPSVLPKLGMGRVLLVGAGGVGSCLAYWLSFVSLEGTWTVVDGDFAQMHNTNRSLGLFPEHTGWSGQAAVNKARAAADLIGCEFVDKWYEDLKLELLQPDLILPLANDRGVRAEISQLGEPVLLYATTASQGEAQLHRHIPGKDDCIVCRMPRKDSGADFKCSEAKIQIAETSADAALPFLSATAGLMLLAGLYRLAHGDLAACRYNIWRSNLLSSHRLMYPGHYSCCGPCRQVPSATIRRRLHASSRWFHLDEQARQA